MICSSNPFIQNAVVAVGTGQSMTPGVIGYIADTSSDYDETQATPRAR